MSTTKHTLCISTLTQWNNYHLDLLIVTSKDGMFDVCSFFLQLKQSSMSNGVIDIQANQTISIWTTLSFSIYGTSFQLSLKMFHSIDKITKEWNHIRRMLVVWKMIGNDSINKRLFKNQIQNKEWKEYKFFWNITQQQSFHFYFSLIVHFNDCVFSLSISFNKHKYSNNLRKSISPSKNRKNRTSPSSKKFFHWYRRAYF